VGFQSDKDKLAYYKRLAANTSRHDVPLPDTWPQIKIHGVMWIVPPRGHRVEPQFDDEGHFVGIEGKTPDTWPEIDALCKAIKLPEDVVCPKCGQPTDTSAAVTENVLQAAFALIVRALRAHYDLAPVQLAELLAFEGPGVPEWFKPLLRWATGQPIEPPDPYLMQDWDAMSGLLSAPEPPAPKRKKRRRRRRRKRRE
jgi:hypothetical protein